MIIWKIKIYHGHKGEHNNTVNFFIINHSTFGISEIMANDVFKVYYRQCSNIKYRYLSIEHLVKISLILYHMSTSFQNSNNIGTWYSNTLW